MNWYRALLIGLVGVGWAIVPHVDAQVVKPTVPVGSVVTGAIAVTQAFNVFQINAAGGNRRALTARGTGYNGTYYPSYAYSPDGKYLLLVRAERGVGTLLLLNPNGATLRTLARIPLTTDFAPAWARDGDRIVYIASESQQQRPSPVTVNSVDLQGHVSLLWHYTSAGICQGVVPDPVERFFWQQTGFNGLAPTIQWSIGRHLAVYSNTCGGRSLAVVDTRSRVSRELNTTWAEGALSTSGRLAATQVVRGSRRIVLTYPSPGAPVRGVAPGELPLWSRDAHFLYFVQRVRGMNIYLRNPSGRLFRSGTYTSAIFRANADGTYLLRLNQQDAYGLGPLSLTPDNLSLVFCRVDNLWHLWNHRLAGGRYTIELARQFGPHIAVQRFVSGETALTLATDAGQPAVQP